MKQGKIKCGWQPAYPMTHYTALIQGIIDFRKITNYLERILVGRTNVEQAKDDYTDQKLVAFLLQGMSGTKNETILKE